MASDGFLPFIDNIDEVKECVTAIVEPGGSKNDDVIINACEKHNIVLVFTDERCFSHF